MTALSPTAAQPVSPPPQPADPASPASMPRGSAASPGAAPTPTGRGPRPETPSGPSLSPSRAADFKTCPLLFRFRSIDRLPETPSADQVRGTLVHAVLERLFDLPAADRTLEAATALVTPQWERLLTEEPELSGLFATEPPPRGRPAPSPRSGSRTPSSPGESPADADAASTTGIRPSGAGARAADTTGIAASPDLSSRDAGPVAPGGSVLRDPAAVAAEADATGQATLIDVPGGEAEAARLAAFLTSARELLSGYFAVEDPRRLEPAERETLISTMIGEDALLLRGYIDRLDVSPAGDLRVVDYKTGGAPREAFEGRALFQLKFYALVLWRTRGVVPRALRLLYLKDAEALDYSPDQGELERFERTLLALSQAIERAKQNQDFRPKPSRLCGWCSHQARCPEFGGTPPAYPQTIAIGPSPDSTLLRDDPLG